jgi:hypothetical protein
MVSMVFITLQVIHFSLKLVDGQLSLCVEIIDYATSALIMRLKMRHTLQWSVPCLTPIEISFHHYLRINTLK